MLGHSGLKLAGHLRPGILIIYSSIQPTIHPSDPKDVMVYRKTLLDPHNAFGRRLASWLF